MNLKRGFPEVWTCPAAVLREYALHQRPAKTKSTVLPWKERVNSDRLSSIVPPGRYENRGRFLSVKTTGPHNCGPLPILSVSHPHCDHSAKTVNLEPASPRRRFKPKSRQILGRYRADSDKFTACGKYGDFRFR